MNISLNTNAGNVTSAAAEIAEFDLSTGYSADFSSTLMGYEIAASRRDGPCHIYLIQPENEADRQKLEQVLDQLVIRSLDPKNVWRSLKNLLSSCAGKRQPWCGLAPKSRHS